MGSWVNGHDGHGRRIPAGRRYKVQAARRSIVRAIFFRARKIRFMTVPIGTFSVSAISVVLQVLVVMEHENSSIHWRQASRSLERSLGSQSASTSSGSGWLQRRTWLRKPHSRRRRLSQSMHVFRVIVETQVLKSIDCRRCPA